MGLILLRVSGLRRVTEKVPYSTHGRLPGLPGLATMIALERSLNHLVFLYTFCNSNNQTDLMRCFVDVRLRLQLDRRVAASKSRFGD